MLRRFRFQHGPEQLHRNVPWEQGVEQPLRRLLVYVVHLRRGKTLGLLVDLRSIRPADADTRMSGRFQPLFELLFRGFLRHLMHLFANGADR